jgi:hypothetical protein
MVAGPRKMFLLKKRTKRLFDPAAVLSGGTNT